MRKLETITGIDLINKLEEMYETFKMEPNDKFHFELRYNKWLQELPNNVTLSNNNYTGKLTKALLALMELEKQPTKHSELIELLTRK